MTGVQGASPSEAGGNLLLGKLIQNTTPAAVAQILRAAILDGTLRPGSQLREVPIAAELGVSRHPVRDSFSILADEGLVAKIAYRGAFVAEVSTRQVQEITGVRQRLEPWAVELALPKLADGGRLRLVGALEAMLRAADDHDLARLLDAHMTFHRVFYELSDHGVLLDLWRSWEAQLQLFLSADQRTLNDLHDVVASHDRLLRIVDSGDIDAIRDELQRHIHGPSEADGS